MEVCLSRIAVVLLCLSSVISQNVRLIPGPDKGRLEVNHTGSWGTVCYSSFKNQAASVVCRSLNQPSNNAYWVTSQKFGRGSLNPRLSGVTCSGQETSIFNCTLTRASASSSSCSTTYVVGIVCTNEAQKAFFRYGTPFIRSASTIAVFERSGIYCYPGNDTYTRDFIMSIKKDNRLLSSRNSYGYYTVTRSHEGPLSCSVSNWQMPNQDTLTVDVNVMFPPTDFVTSKITVIEGTSVNVTLTNQPNPLPYQTTWRQTGTSRKWNQTEVYRMYNSISRTDGGEFLVNISNQMNSSFGTTRRGNGLELLFVDVLYKPTLRCEEKYIVVKGSKVNITCEVDGKPLPHLYIWTNSSGDHVASGPKPSLVIASAGPETIGRYKCTAVNEMKDSMGKTKSGVDLAEIEISLGDGPTGPPTTSPPEPESLSTLTYAMIGVAVVSLLAVLIMAVVLIKMWKTTKDISSIPHETNTNIRSENSVSYRKDPDYTNLAFHKNVYQN